MNKPLSAFGYPGGKVRAIKYMARHFQQDFTEYREVFAGGASVALWLMQRYPHAKYWLNDLFPPIAAFWKTLRNDPDKMVQRLFQIKKQFGHDAKKLFDYCQDALDESDNLEKACKEWILRKISYGSLAHIGTNRGTTNKFSETAIINLLDLGYLLQNVNSLKITNHDYSNCLSAPGNDVMIYADPPYKLKRYYYGKNGDLHRNFDHQEFSQRMKACTHDWMITYNDCDDIRSWYADYHLIPLDLTYILATKRPAYELIITNYDSELPVPPITTNRRQSKTT